MFYITYPALVFSIYLLLDMTSEYGTPLIETVFVAGGFLVIPLIGGAHIHEMYSKPLIRKGLRLVGYTEVIETLVGEGLESLFV